jgi:hypothetical protein
MSGRLTIHCLTGWRMACDCTREEADRFMAIIKAGNPLTLETPTSRALIMPQFVISAEYRDRPAIVPSKLTQDEVQELERHDKMQFSEG